MTHAPAPHRGRGNGNTPPRLCGLDLSRLHDERRLHSHVVLNDFSLSDNRGAVQYIDPGDMAQGLGRTRDCLLGGVAPALIGNADELNEPNYSCAFACSVLGLMLAPFVSKRDSIRGKLLHSQSPT